jgi:hypothetical protein
LFIELPRKGKFSEGVAQGITLDYCCG